MKMFSLSVCAAAYGTAVWHCLPVDVPSEKEAQVPAQEERAVSVLSGNTLSVRMNGEEVTVRIDGVEAPAANDSLAGEARTALQAIMKNQPVRVTITGRDKDGLALSRVWCGEANVGERLLREGWAFYRTGHDADLDDAILVDAEAEARLHRRGMWAHQHPLIPARTTPNRMID